MKIELPVRWVDNSPNPEMDEERKNYRIITGEEEVDALTNYIYDPMVMDTKDIKLWHKYDDEHTVLKTYENDSYCIKIPYEGFNEIYMQMTGENVYKLQIKERIRRKKS